MMRRPTLLAICMALVAASTSVCPAQVMKKKSSGYMEFNFDQVDVRSFVKVVGEVTGKRIAIGEDVEGKITVVSPRIPTDQAFTVFASILESVGCSVVEQEDGSFRVVKLGKRVTQPTRVIGPDEKLPVLGVITKVFRLQFVRAAELKGVLVSKVGGGKEGAVASIDSTNHLIVTDTAENIRRIEKIVAEVDRSDSSVSTEVVAVKFADATDIAEQLGRAMALDAASRTRAYQRYLKPSDAQAMSGGQRGVTIVASPHSNSVILVGPTAQVDGAKKLVALMDVDSPSGRGRLSVIFLRYVSAQDAAKSLNALLSKKIQKTGVPTRGGPPKISIEPHVPNNALLVDAMPQDFALVQNVVKDLDKPPEQVVIDVLIAEVSLNQSSDIGVSFVGLDLPREEGSVTVQGSSLVKEDASQVMGAIQSGLFPGGITVGLAHGTREDASGNIIPGFPGIVNIDAVRKDGNFNIRSNVRLQAQNNKEASVSIVNNIPILKSTVSGTGATRDIIQNIERIDVGIKLKLTPHINPNGEVTMDLNPSIEAIIDPGAVAEKLAPTIARREISTTVTVADGDTIVLSGLIREDQVESVRKVPILGSIPLIGLLFRHSVKSTEKTDLLVFVTPHLGMQPAQVTGRKGGIPVFTASDSIAKDSKSRKDARSDRKTSE